MAQWMGICLLMNEFDPWSRRIPHASQQVGPCATTTEARTPRTRALQQEMPPQ